MNENAMDFLKIYSEQRNTKENESRRDDHKMKTTMKPPREIIFLSRQYMVVGHTRSQTAGSV